MESKPSQLSPTEEAKRRAQGLGAPVVMPQGAHPQSQVPLPPMQQPQMAAPPGPDPQQLQQYQQVPGQYPPQMQPMQQQQQQQALAPGQGVPLQQFAQAASQPQQTRMAPEQVKEGLQALADAQKREEAMRAAEAPQEETEPEEANTAQEEEDDSPLLQSMDEDLASALDRFNNSPRRAKIESKLEKMNAEDLVSIGEIRQEVPISAGVKVVFRTTSGIEHDGMLDELGTVANSSSGSELYLRERLANYNLTLSLYQIGSTVLPSHLDKDGEFSVEGFRKKFREVMRRPLLLIADMRVNCYWFDERVRRVMVAEELGNG